MGEGDEDTRRAIVAARCDSAQGEFDCYGGVGGVYLTIDSWLPEERVEYDRQKEV